MYWAFNAYGFIGTPSPSPAECLRRNPRAAGCMRRDHREPSPWKEGGDYISTPYWQGYGRPAPSWMWRERGWTRGGVKRALRRGWIHDPDASGRARPLKRDW